MNVPKLRFKEFKGNWKLKKVSEIMQKVSQSVSVELDTMYRQIGIRSHGKGIFHKEPVTGKSLGNKRIFWVQENLFVVNIVFAWEQAVAKTSSSEVGMVASHRFPMYKQKGNLSNLNYILYFFLTDKGKNYLELASPGGAGRNKTLGQKNFEELNLTIPEVNEQTKIAEFLMAIDEKITQLTQKCELLARYKKGVMQKIFSQELRFKDDDGRDFPDWETKKLGDIFEITSGTTPFRGTSSFFDDGNHPWIKTTDLNNGLIEDTQEKVTDLALEQTSLKLLPKGTVLIAMYGGFNQIGRTGLLTKKAAINQALSAILPRQDLVDSYYLLSYLNHYVENWKEFAASSRKDPNITKSDVKNFNFSFPILKGQIKIANFLTSIDEKITEAQTYLDTVKQYKQGLLQQMFV
jgi:type I restriction enzyme, S subunit